VDSTAIYLIERYWEEAKKLAKSAYDEADSAMVEKYEPSLINEDEAALNGLKAAGVKLAIATNDRYDDTEVTMRR
jgi:phosphoglycolate phosphatase-like HAD superfamily hydrolase